MQLKLEVPGPASTLAEKDRRSFMVETHVKRGDSWNVQRADPVYEGSSVVIDVRPGARLVITPPEEAAAAVFDKEQNAAVRPANQANNSDRADRHQEGVTRQAPMVAPGTTIMPGNTQAPPPQARPMPTAMPNRTPATPPAGDPNAARPAGPSTVHNTGGQSSDDVKAGGKAPEPAKSGPVDQKPDTPKAP